RPLPQPWNYNYGDWIGDGQIMRKHAAEVSGIVHVFGEVLTTLAKLGLAVNTQVIYTAHPGHAGGYAGYWGTRDHTQPLTGFDWTKHIPLIMCLRGVVKNGQRIDQVVRNYDLLQTIMTLQGMPLEDQTIDGTRLVRPGRDFSPLLRGEEDN